MVTYDYNCAKCDKDFETQESIKEYTGLAKCPTCGNISKDRLFKNGSITLIGTGVEDREFNPGLGIVTKNSKHRKDEAKARGLEEMGTECSKKYQDTQEKSLKDRMKKRWDEV